MVAQQFLPRRTGCQLYEYPEDARIRLFFVCKSGEVKTRGMKPSIHGGVNAVCRRLLKQAWDWEVFEEPTNACPWPSALEFPE